MINPGATVRAKIEMVVSNRGKVTTVKKGDIGTVTDWDFQDDQPIFRINWADGASWADENELEIMGTPTC